MNDIVINMVLGNNEYAPRSRVGVPNGAPWWVRFPVGARPSHTKDFKNVSGPCLHGTQDEVGTTKHNWLAQCKYNVTGWVSMWAYDMLTQ